MPRKPRLIVHLWPLCQEAIEAGIMWGFMRWYKYREGQHLTPEDEASLTNQLQNELENAFSDRFRWEED